MRRIQYLLSYEEEDTFQALRAWNAHVCVHIYIISGLGLHTWMLHVEGVAHNPDDSTVMLCVCVCVYTYV